MDFHKFTVKPSDEGGRLLFLDDFKLKGVAKYELSEEAGKEGAILTKLTLTLHIKGVDEVK